MELLERSLTYRIPNIRYGRLGNTIALFLDNAISGPDILMVWIWWMHGLA